MLILSEQQVSVVVVAQVSPLVAVGFFFARGYSQPSKKKLDTAFFGETWLRPL